MTRSEAGRIGWENGVYWRKQQKENRIREYLKSPSLCLYCNNELPYKKRHQTFCSSSCRASHSNIGRQRYGKKPQKCLQCCQMTRNAKYCSTKCQAAYVWSEIKQMLDTMNDFKELKQFNRSTIPKRYLCETRGHQCEVCKNSMWCNKKIPLVLDHINGNSDDWRKINLRLICPNCDAQTSTYCGKNRGNGRFYRRQRYAQGKSS